MEERIAVVSDDDEILRAEVISKVHKLGLLHREAYIYIINENNEVLLQKSSYSDLF